LRGALGVNQTDKLRKTSRLGCDEAVQRKRAR
jgi:hypothetical protein